jgi:hypothetical protein
MDGKERFFAVAQNDKEANPASIRVHLRDPRSIRGRRLRIKNLKMDSRAKPEIDERGQVLRGFSMGNRAVTQDRPYSLLVSFADWWFYAMKFR